MDEKSEFGYTTYGGWTFLEFVDFRFVFGFSISGPILWIPVLITSFHPLRLVRDWYEIGTRMVRDWYEIGMRLVRDWYEIGTRLQQTRKHKKRIN